MRIKKYKTLFVMLVSILSFVFVPNVIAKTIPVPFTLQAPYSDWRQPWQDACEEASTIMIDHFYRGDHSDRIPKEIAKKEILQIVDLEDQYLGFNKDTNAREMVEIINGFFEWEAYLVENPTLEQIKSEIDAERPVILPFYGRIVNNPYFLGGGPYYHVVVVKGYDDQTQDFITHEPGVGKGLDYRYNYDTMMNAIHDFLPNRQTKYGEKLAVFTRGTVFESGGTDADADGLNKAQEMLYGTSLKTDDTDGDGYKDGTEVDFGFSPLINESEIANHELVKTAGSPAVYYVKSRIKHYIINENVFVNRGWQWHKIKTISPKYMDLLKTGIPITN